MCLRKEEEEAAGRLITQTLVALFLAFAAFLERMEVVGLQTLLLGCWEQTTT